MNRRTKLLGVCLVISLAFACWTWMRPYEWSRDAGARYKIVHASVEPDHGYFWLGLYLKQVGPETHDLMKPVILILADGREIEPAGTDLEGDATHPNAGIGFRFWLEEKDLTGPLSLKLNDGVLTVRKKSGPFPVTDSIRFFNTANW